MDRDSPRSLRLAAIGAVIVGSLATARVVFHGLARNRPSRGAEASDLGNLLIHQWAFRTPAGSDLEPLGRAFGYHTRFEVLEYFDFYPPLWYGGAAALLASQSTPTFTPLFLINAIALAVSLWAGWDLAKRTAGALTGFLTVLIIASLPLVAGRMTFIGVEPSHMAVLGLSLRGLVLLRDPKSTRAGAIGLGTIMGAGLLMKWNFLTLLLGPVVLEVFSALRSGALGKAHLQRLVLAGATCSLLFSAWFFPYANLRKILGGQEGMLSEPSHDEGILSIAQIEALLPVIDLGLGWAGIFLVLVAWFAIGWEAGGNRAMPKEQRSVVTMLVSSVATLTIAHLLIPHKELRYFLPAGWILGLLIALGLSYLWTGKLSSLRSKAIVLAGLAWLLFGTFAGRPTYGSGDELRLLTDRSDHGFGALTTLPPSRQDKGKGIILSPETQDYAEVGASLSWEFTIRSDSPIVVQVFPAIGSDPLAEQALQRADYFATNRELSKAEELVLDRHHLEPIREVTIDPEDGVGLPGSKDWVLWARHESG